MATTVALALYLPALAAALVMVWRRPVLAFFAFVVGLAVHNLVMALLYGAGVRGASLTAIAAWKELLLVTALASVTARTRRERRLPFRPGVVDALALSFAAVVLIWALIPQGALGGEAGAEAILYSVRHALVPVGAYVLGRSLLLGPGELGRLGWTVLGTAAAVASFGLVEVYAVSLDWWRGSGAVGWFRDQLDLEYQGLSGLPENFVFNTGDERPVRRLVSTFLSPLATAYLLAVALLLVAARPRPPAVLALTPLLVAGLLFTHSRSAFIALAGALCVLGLAIRRWWPIVVSAAWVVLALAFVEIYPDVGPRTSFTTAELAFQREQAEERPGAEHTATSFDEPSVESHLRNLRDGLETVAEHPQGYGPGNAGAVAVRFDEPLQAGESNYTELGVETGVLGLALFVAWSLALLVGLLRGRGWAAAWLAAALALVLALGVQTDAIGVPWLAYCVFGLGGVLAAPAVVRVGKASPLEPRIAPGQGS